jgi:hypothetical protein
VEPLKDIPRIGEGVRGELKLIDSSRTLIVSLVHYLALYFSREEMNRQSDLEIDTFKKLAKTMKELTRKTGFDGMMLIRFRGFLTSAKTPQRIDYIVRFGNIEVDILQIPIILKRMAQPSPEIAKRLHNAFTLFSDLGITSMTVMFPGGSSKKLTNIRRSLQILSYYFSVVSGRIPENSSHPIISGEYNDPDPNLTQISVLCKIDSRKMKALVEQVHALMTTSSSAAAKKQYVSVYEAVFSVKKLRSKVIRM